jgi:uncharacterized metal-binding protein
MESKDFKALYTSQSLQIMNDAEDALDRTSDRVTELKNYARQAGIKRIGIGHCMAVTKEANAVKNFLADEFEVVSIDCKCGKLTKMDMLGREGAAIMCNPAGQAQLLSENNTELNISMGLCVGHDMIFNQCSKAPVTTLLVKDRVNKHNPMEVISKLKS